MINIYIFGAGGQDGSIIRSKLERSGQEIKLFLFSRQSLKIKEKNKVSFEYSIANQFDYINLVNRFIIEESPNLIFYFAAVHISSTESEENINSEEMFFSNYGLVAFIFNKCQILEIKPKFIYASSSLIFSGSEICPQNENTKREPKCNYSKQKVLTEELLINLGKKCEIPVLIPIFYNHESVNRQEKFFTKKVISFCSKKSKNLLINTDNNLTLFNKDSIIDIGYAPEYMEILLELINKDVVGSFIFSSGNPISVKLFVDNVLNFYGLSSDLILYKSMEKRFEKDLIGDNRKLISCTRITPVINGKELVYKLCCDYENYIESNK